MMLDTLDDLIARLAPDTLLRALAPGQLEQLLREATRRDLRPGEPIISQGDEDGDFAVVVLTGGLKITMVSASGHEIILNYCGPGELVGEIAMLDSGPRTATVIAAVPSAVLLLPSHTFLAAATANASAPATAALPAVALGTVVHVEHLTAPLDAVGAAALGLRPGAEFAIITAEMSTNTLASELEAL